MARKYELINDLYDQIIVDVTKEARAWQSFLRTACRNYKLRFDEQLLLFAQRPDATAVLEIERWNTAFGRWVNRGAKGIAVFEDSTGESQRLKYYFDIADTHGTEQSREVPVWKMSDEYQSDVTEALKNTFGTLSDLDSLESVIKESVSNAVDDNIDDYIYNFIRNGTGSEIDYISTDEAEEIYKRLVKNSVVYMISERLGADSGLTESDFDGIEYFSTHELLNSIGYATSDIAKMGLGVVAKTVRAIEKENQQAIMPDNNISYNSERSSNYERNHLHNAGRLSDSGSIITGTAGGNTRQMGTDEKGISEAAPQDNVLQSDDELSVNTVPRRNGTESAQTGGRADQRDVGKTGADRRAESERYDEMGSADEQSQARSSRDSYSADNNERLSNIKPLPSINEQTAFIAEYEAEVTKASAFSIPNEIINDHLANGSGFRDGKYRIYEQFRRSLSQKENADFLKNEYGIGGGTHAGGVSGYHYDHNAKGICISKGYADNAPKINLNWLEVAKRIQLLINNDRYLNAKEKEHYAQWLNEREERQYTEQGLSTSENKDNEKYIYKVGDTVFIGASEYRITAKDDQQVMLSDANAPLFNKQYDIADFEHKIKENALNEHLKVILSEEESNTSVISETNTTPINDDDYYFNDAERKEVVPESEVRFIHEADTDVKKKELFQKTRKGEVRVLLGSTQKMGAGTNVQDRLIALHDIDCPWRPSDLEQRAGRIIRQGNSNPEVEIYRYVTEQTFDAYLYQLVEGKQKFASQIMASKSPVRSADDIDETALSYAEIKMLATGNPYIKEKMDLDIQVQKLKLLKANYLSEKYNLEDKIIKFYPQKIAALNNTIKALEQDLATAKAHPKPSDDSFVGIEIDGKYISEKADAGKAILEFCKQMNNPDPIAIGKYRGFDMELQFSSGVVHCYEIALKGATTQKVSLGEDANGNITRIDNAIGRLSEHIENAKVELKNIQTQYETAQIEVQKPFAQEEELKAKTKRQIEVEKLISSGENEPEQNAISDYYYFSATDEQINALNNASIPFEKQTKADGSMVIRVATDDKSKAEAIMNSKNLIL